MTTILVVGDAHVNDVDPNTRFKWLGEYAVEHMPDHIVFMGDFLTLNCLSSWDMNKRAKMEGRRYLYEIESGNEALDFFEAATKEYNKASKKNKKKGYNPQITFLLGNHEDRLSRYLEGDPTFDGHISIEKDLRLKERGYDVVPYMKYKYINDIGFTHIPFNKVSPISGSDITRKAQGVTIKSVVFGHTHELHVSNRHVEGMDHLQQTLNCGCFFEQDEEYVQGKLTQYWKGIILLDSYKPGRFDMHTCSMGQLERRYS